MECCSIATNPWFSNACTDPQLASEFIGDTVLCAGNSTARVGICNGDSGGPLTYFNETHHILVGVTSFGFGKCEGDYYDGFARVTHEIKWIKENGDDYVRRCNGGGNITTNPSTVIPFPATPYGGIFGKILVLIFI